MTDQVDSSWPLRFINKGGIVACNGIDQWIVTDRAWHGDLQLQIKIDNIHKT